MGTIYLDSTIPSYLTARKSYDPIVRANQEITINWWRKYRSKYKFWVSQYVIEEIKEGDPGLATKRLRLIHRMSLLKMKDTIEKLAIEYAKRFQLPRKAYVDAFHLAFSVEYKIDYLLTWNCRHLANGNVMLKLQEYNLKKNLHLPVILTPQELIY